MLQIILRSHSGLRWIILLLLLVTIVNAFRKWKGKQAFTSMDNRLSLISLITVHLQLLLGLYLFLTSPKVMLSGLDMSNAIQRFFTIEHTLGMLVAIVLITVGRSQSKRLKESSAKHRKVFVMYLAGLVVMLISIPWPFRALGAGWF